MTYGIDTDFLIACEILDHPLHQPADKLLQKLLGEEHHLALAPQTLAEFIHVVTDPRRMPEPLTVTEAISRAEHWWQAKEVLRIFPDGHAVSDFFAWLRRYQLGRKRLLDTLLAASLRNANVQKIITNNARDYAVLKAFEVIEFR
ncbi:MAG: PIN domain-containing protein [Verrucomicrobiota bacterium]